MKKTLTLAFVCVQLLAFAQHEIGHTTITFNDPNRTGGFGSGGGPGRQIQTEIYYPAAMAGEDVDLSAGTYPVITFGHGFVMAWDAYTNIWEELVPLGYIIAFPRTEGGFSPSHEAYGLDLALVSTALKAKGTDNTSLFYNHIQSESAILGHSMGGGSTILAAANNSDITTIIGFAPAETDPSAISAASSVNVPALIFSADQDFVTPQNEHHQPIYNALGSSCSYFVNIIGGAHCYYANSNFNCDFGEGSSGGSISISREEQHTIMFRYMIPWLDLYLKNDCSQKDIFEVDLATDSDVTYSSTCPSLGNEFDLTVTNNAGELTAHQSNVSYQWIDCGSDTPIASATSQTFTPAQNGSYAVVLGDDSCADTSACVTISSLSLPSHSIEKGKVIRTYNLLGQEVEPVPNVLLLFEYSDGTYKKGMLVE